MKKIIIVSLFFMLVLSGCSSTSDKKLMKIIKPEEAKAKAEEFINSTLMPPGASATIDEVVEENGLYKLKVNTGSQDVESYITMDGKNFFPQVMDIDKIKNEQENNNNANSGDQPVADAPKSDKPIVDLVITSYCPFGLQAVKGIVPTIKALGDKVDFSFKYFNIPSHGEKEEIEGKLQICIREKAYDKMLDYASCFADSGDSKVCLSKNGIDETLINDCMDNEINKYYSGTSEVGLKTGSSPTLIINGQEIQSGRDSESYLNTICSAFIERPSECDAKLSSASPSSGFGADTSEDGSDATCE